MEKRSGLLGSLRKAVNPQPSATAKNPGGRDLEAKPNKGIKGRFGTSAKGGRIWGQPTGTGPLEKYLERGRTSDDMT